jgi:hypothetical protein
MLDGLREENQLPPTLELALFAVALAAAVALAIAIVSVLVGWA